MNDTVLHEKRGEAFWIIINRPDKRNAINEPVIQGIRAGINAACADRDIRVVVLTGSGDHAFCAGGDLQPGGGFNFDFASPRSAYGDLLRAADDCPLPIVAAINGACVAGGMGLVAMADLAISVDHAQFGLPEVKIGLFPMQVLAMMKTLVPPRTLRRWMLTGEIFPASQAFEAGFLNQVVAADAFNDAVEALVDKLCAVSPAALRRGKYATRTMEAMTKEQAIAFAEGQLGLMTLTEDAQEGLAAFNEKRKPQFTGR
jgi:enoyl-CoA hydratase/carnithine racemase